MGLLLILVFVTAATSLAAAYNPLLESKIIGGRTIHVDDARFMVQVITLDENAKTNESSITLCGGTLVSATHVLTAAHCVTRPEDVGKMIVIVGSSEYLANGKNGKMVRVKDVRAHPKFTIIGENHEAYGFFDVAVIRLEVPVLPSPKTSFITVTKPRAEPKAGTSIKVAGWGIYRRQETSRKLRLGTFKVIKRAQCLKDLGKSFNDQEFCITSNPKSAFCSGDSGGPAFIGRVQYGVVSWGSCGEGRRPSSILANLADPQINSFVKMMIRKL